MATAVRPGSLIPSVAAGFSGGLNLRDAADELAPSESPDLFNVTYDERGGTGSRLGMEKYNAAGMYRDAVLAAVPLLYWRMDEPSGTTFADSSGNGLNGTLEGSGSYAQPGLLAGDTDTAFKFAAGGDIFNAAATFSLTAGSYAISALVKRTTPGHRDAIFWMGDSVTGVGVYLYFDTDDKLKLALGSGAAGVGLTVIATSSVTTADTNTHSIGFSANGGRLYLDGAVVAAAGGSTAGAGAGICRVGAGGFSSGTVALATAVVDEVAVFQSGLSDATFIGLYNVATSSVGSYSTTDTVNSGFAWDSAGHKVVQASASVFLDTSVVAFHTFTTSAPCSFAAFAGKLWLLHPVDGLFQSDGTSGGTAAVPAGPVGVSLTPWQNKLFAVDGTSARLYWSAIGDGTVWTPSATTLNGSVTLPTATITVVSTTGFDPAGAITIGTGSSAQIVTYTGVTATTFTGCTGGTHFFATGTVVTQGSNFNDLREKDDTPLVCLKGGSGQDILGAPGLIAFKNRSTYRINDADTGSYTTLDPEVGCAGPRAAVAAVGRVYALSEKGIWWTDGRGPMVNEGDKLRPLWSDSQLAFDQLSLWCAGEKAGRLSFSVPLAGKLANGLALEHFPAGKPDDAATVVGSNAVSCYFTSHADEEKLFGGSPSVPGQVYEMGVGGTDDGAAIHAYWESAWLPIVPNYLARLRELVVEGRGDSLTVFVKTDYETEQGDEYSVPLSLTSVKWDDGSVWDDGENWGPSRFVAYSDPLPSLGVGRVFAFRFDATTTDTNIAPALLNGALTAEVGSWAVFGLHFKSIPLRPI